MSDETKRPPFPSQSTLRPSLPLRTLRPANTSAYDSFWRALSEVNAFYWLASAGFDALVRLRPSDAKHPKDFIESNIANHLNIIISPSEAESAARLNVIVPPLAKFDGQLAEQPQRLLYLTLVDIVTFYEEFLIQTLIRELPIRSKPNPKKTLYQQAKSIINGKYENRPEDLDDALELDIVSLGSEHDLVLADLKAAFLARNCIVHTGGVVGEREKSLAALMPDITLGGRMPLSEAVWRRFLEAMNRHVQDIDLLTRVGYSRPLPT